MSTTDRAGWLVLALSGSLDLTSAPAFRSATRSFHTHPGALAVDLSAVDLIDSVGLGLLIGLRRRQCAVPDGRFELRGLSMMAAEVFSAAGLSELFDIHPERIGNPERIGAASRDGNGGR